MSPIRLLVMALALGLAAGCVRASGPPAIALGTPCARCGMEIQDRRFACEQEANGRWRVYDAIECLLADPAPGASVWLPDYDLQTLHHADSLWVVRGSFTTPMGGGYAAFRSRAAADSVSATTHGFVGRLSEFAGGKS